MRARRCVRRLRARRIRICIRDVAATSSIALSVQNGKSHLLRASARRRSRQLGMKGCRSSSVDSLVATFLEEAAPSVGKGSAWALNDVASAARRSEAIASDRRPIRKRQRECTRAAAGEVGCALTAAEDCSSASFSLPEAR